MSKRKKQKRVYKASVTCHICALPIPDWIVDPRHRLLGTIDHVLPFSRGGTDAATNRMPAHKFCNSAKGALDVCDSLRKDCRSIILESFSGIALPNTKRWSKLRKQVNRGNDLIVPIQDEAKP